jgi:ATP-dependent protease ClpP protease subunit
MYRYLLILLLTCSALAPKAYSANALKIDAKRVVRVVGEVRSLRAEIFQLALKSLESNAPIVLMIDSPGGHVDGGMEFIEAMRSLKERNMKFVCVTKMAASMGMAIFSECTSRYAFKDSEILWHPVKARTNQGISADDAEQLAKRLRELDDQVWTVTRQQLNVSDEVWKKHYQEETMHTGEGLKKISPGYLQIIDEIKGEEFRIFNDPLEELLKQFMPDLKMPTAPVAP